MPTLSIRRGLRKLQFEPRESMSGTRVMSHVIVEFATTGALGPTQVVRINLGVREGIVRNLEGLPRLIKPGKRAADEFLYRLEGDVG